MENSILRVINFNTKMFILNWSGLNKGIKFFSPYKFYEKKTELIDEEAGQWSWDLSEMSARLVVKIGLLQLQIVLWTSRSCLSKVNPFVLLFNQSWVQSGHTVQTSFNPIRTSSLAIKTLPHWLVNKDDGMISEDKWILTKKHFSLFDCSSPLRRSINERMTTQKIFYIFAFHYLIFSLSDTLKKADDIYVRLQIQELLMNMVSVEATAYIKLVNWSKIQES